MHCDICKINMDGGNDHPHAIYICKECRTNIMNTKTLYIMRGLPGSGKSTAAKLLSEHVFSTDDFFMVDGEYKFDPAFLAANHVKNQTAVLNAMAKGLAPIVVANTATKAWEMKPYVSMAEAHGYEVVICYPETPWAWDADECAKRNVHGVPLHAIRAMLLRFEKDLTLEDIKNSRSPF